MDEETSVPDLFLAAMCTFVLLKVPYKKANGESDCPNPLCTKLRRSDD